MMRGRGGTQLCQSPAASPLVLVVLAAHFPSPQGVVPVQGGWGYAMEDACVFDNADPLVDPGWEVHRSF